VAVVDVDFHHGNGTQDAFREEPDVLYVSLQGDPAGHYPHFTGARDETGGGRGRGATRNFPLPDGTGDDHYLLALTAACELVAGFGAAAMVVSFGFDTLDGDPLGAFRLSGDGFRRFGRLLAGLGLPTLLVQEGGFALDAIGACAVAALAGFQAGMSGLS
jgi:acetoin utilization deacetylase AcuC-like enzyme